jgi:hypothetical protein
MPRAEAGPARSCTNDDSSRRAVQVEASTAGAQHNLDGRKEPGRGGVRKRARGGPERPTIGRELALGRSGAVARITRPRASSRWGLGAGRGSGGPNGIKSPAARPPWGRRVPEIPGPPVYAGSGRRCGGRGCGRRGAEPGHLSLAHGAVVTVLRAEARTPPRRREPPRCGGADYRKVPGLRSGLVGTTSPDRRPLDPTPSVSGQRPQVRGFRGKRPLGERGGAHAVAPRGNFPRPKSS